MKQEAELLLSAVERSYHNERAPGDPLILRLRAPYSEECFESAVIKKKGLEGIALKASKSSKGKRYESKRSY